MGINFEQWLDDLGLGHDIESFRDHALDFDVLDELSEVGPTDLGIRLEDRKRLPRAIAALAVDDGADGTVQPATAAGTHNFMGSSALPSRARAPRVP